MDLGLRLFWPDIAGLDLLGGLGLDLKLLLRPSHGLHTSPTGVGYWLQRAWDPENEAK